MQNVKFNIKNFKIKKVVTIKILITLFNLYTKAIIVFFYKIKNFKSHFYL